MRSDLALAALASAAVPGMKPVSVAGLTDRSEVRPDWQQAVIEDATGRRWLVRSPLTPVAGARLQQGDDLVRQLSRHVPFKVPAPVGYADVGRDGRAVVYPHVEGMPLDLTRLPSGAGLASAVGRALAAIHNIPPGAFEEQEVPVFDAAGFRQRLTAEVDRAAETGRVPTGLLARWEEAFDAAPLWQFATTPVHGAFRGSTVLVTFTDDADAASGRVVAVTDWEEAMVADPAVDLAEIYFQASPAAWEVVLDSYALARAQRPDPHLHARARMLSETNRLRGLTTAVEEEDEDGARRVVEGLRRLDRLTEEADSLVPTTARPAGTAGPASPDTGRAQDELEAPDPEPEPDQVGPTGPSAHGVSGREPERDQVEPMGPGLHGVPVQDQDDVTAEVPVPPKLPDEAPAPPKPPDDAPGNSSDDGQPAAVADREPDEPGVDHDSDPVPSRTAEPAADELRDDELQDDEERLHELYGMPTPGDQSAEHDDEQDEQREPR